MDNSKEFNLMLDKAIEAHPEGFERFDRTKNVQDQLQEMVGEASEIILLELLFCFVFDIDKHCWQTEYTKQFTSMEQLEFAFIMKEKYNKVWVDNNWETIPF